MHVYTDASTVRKHDENAARCRLPVLLASAVPGPQTSKQARGVGQVRTRGWACRQRVIGSNHTPHRRAGLVTLDHHRGLPKELRHVVVPLGVAERKGGLRRALVVLRRLHTRFSFATECSCCVTVTLSALDSPPRASRPRARIEEACRYPSLSRPATWRKMKPEDRPLSSRPGAMHRSEPAPRRGGMGNYSSYRDSPNRARGPGSGPCSPAKGSPSAGRVEGRRRTGGVQRFRPGSSAPQMQSGRCGAAAPPPRVKNEEDDEGMPKLVGRPEKWSIAQHDLAICQWSGFGWAQCDRCNKWRKPSVAGVDLDVNENDSFVCSDMGDGPGGCPLGCETPEDRSWTSMLAFLGESVQLDEQETLQNGYIENAVNFVVFKAEDAGIFKGNQGAAQKFINDVGCDALADVNELKDLVGRLEAKIKENFKRTDEIREWRSQVAVASTAVEVYRLHSRSLLILLSMLYRL